MSKIFWKSPVYTSRTHKPDLQLSLQWISVVMSRSSDIVVKINNVNTGPSLCLYSQVLNS